MTKNEDISEEAKKAYLPEGDPNPELEPQDGQD